jgi:aspartate racemase
MEGSVYQGAFGRAGIGLRTPDPADRALVDRVIFDELTQGVLTDESRAEFVRIIEGLRRAGCDAVALSCTEIPLLITPEVSPLPTLDSTRLLAWAAVAAALRARESPVGVSS